MESCPQPIKDALAFEQSNFTIGTCADDLFYTTPGEAATAVPGALLRTEHDTDTSHYLIPPGTALSRILYQSETVQGSPVPVSAIILWPYTASPKGDGLPVVAWAHGTSGLAPDCAPSHHKNVWQHFLAPYQLVLQGYVVVATDYMGLGVSKRPTGEDIVHEYLASPGHANDIVYGVQAAQSAFPALSKRFVVIGHSQGGGAAWAVAQRQVHKPVDGYLGAVAVSPVTRVLDDPGELAPILGLAFCQTVALVDTDFDIATALTPEGQQALEMVQKLRAGIASAVGLLSGTLQAGVALLKPGWKNNEHIQRFQHLVETGGHPIGGPLLVIHGETDPRLSAGVTTQAVEKTATLHPSSHIDYTILPHVTHTPALLASQKLWMDWIGDRFDEVRTQSGLRCKTIKSVRPAASYHPEQNWYLEQAKDFYHAP